MVGERPLERDALSVHDGELESSFSITPSGDRVELLRQCCCDSVATCLHRLNERHGGERIRDVLLGIPDLASTLGATTLRSPQVVDAEVEDHCHPTVGDLGSKCGVHARRPVFFLTVVFEEAVVDQPLDVRGRGQCLRGEVQLQHTADLCLQEVTDLLAAVEGTNCGDDGHDLVKRAQRVCILCEPDEHVPNLLATAVGADVARSPFEMVDHADEVLLGRDSVSRFLIRQHVQRPFMSDRSLEDVVEARELDELAQSGHGVVRAHGVHLCLRDLGVEDVSPTDLTLDDVTRDARGHARISERLHEPSEVHLERRLTHLDRQEDVQAGMILLNIRKHEGLGRGVEALEGAGARVDQLGERIDELLTESRADDDVEPKLRIGFLGESTTRRSLLVHGFSF